MSSTSKAVTDGLLDFLVEKGDQNLLSEVTDSLEKEIAKTKETNEIVVTSPVHLTPLQLKKIKTVVQKKMRVKFPIINKIDKKLIGGFTLRINDWFLDSSISHQIELSKRLLLA